MKGVYMFFAEGFEETEAIAPADILIRGGIDLKTVSISDSLTVTSSHGISVITDLTLDEFKDIAVSDGTESSDMMIFPGGMPGSTNLAQCGELMEMMADHYGNGGSVAAICAAPSVVLSKLSGLEGKVMTCYDGFEHTLAEKGAIHTTEGVAVDGNMITGRGAGHAVAFGLAILAHIKGQETADKVAKSIML